MKEKQITLRLSSKEADMKPKISENPPPLILALYGDSEALLNHISGGKIKPDIWLVEEPYPVIFYCENEPVRAEVVLSLRYHDWCELEQSEVWKRLVDCLRVNKERRIRQQKVKAEC